MPECILLPPGTQACQKVLACSPNPQQSPPQSNQPTPSPPDHLQRANSSMPLAPECWSCARAQPAWTKFLPTAPGRPGRLTHQCRIKKPLSPPAQLFVQCPAP